MTATSKCSISQLKEKQDDLSVSNSLGCGFLQSSSPEIHEEDLSETLTESHLIEALEYEEMEDWKDEHFSGEETLRGHEEADGEDLSETLTGSLQDDEKEDEMNEQFSEEQVASEQEADTEEEINTKKKGEEETTFSDGDKSKEALNSIGIHVGDNVIVSGTPGIVKYTGFTHFAKGLWIGITIEKAIGLNNGSVDEIEYFKAPPKCGVFAPPHKVLVVKKAKDGHMRAISKIPEDKPSQKKYFRAPTPNVPHPLQQRTPPLPLQYRKSTPNL